ncbi:sucrose synthase-like [Quercus suber]|uniref:sucrose synthase-like n=1 Tax=Quercus suber TaxID=58331 RepID=UPI0032DF94AE
MLNERIKSLNALQNVLRKAEDYPSAIAPETPYLEFEHKLREIGLERGWGNNAERVSEMIHHVLDLLEAPEPRTPETFLGRIPMVVYILDQVRALESEMLLRINHQGLYIIPRILIVTRFLPDAVGTTCGVRLEKVYGTEHSYILRVPSQSEKGIVRKWISRFEVWLYLDTYAEDVANELSIEFHSAP